MSGASKRFCIAALIAAITLSVALAFAALAPSAYAEPDGAVDEPVSELVVADDIAAPTTPSVTYRGHQQFQGWMDWVADGKAAGLTGQSLRLEAFQAKVEGGELTGSIEYRAHVQSCGWQDWVADGATAGTTGMSKRVEAIQIRLTGELADAYDVYYRVHIQKHGWLGWAKNGEKAGSAGCKFRMESIQIRLVPKGEAAPGSSDNAYRTFSLSYTTHVQRQGWQGWVNAPATSGTTGQALRVEALKMDLDNNAWNGSIQYRTHVQTYGWLGWTDDGKVAGTTGEGRRVEAVQIRLTGEMATNYDIYYRVHAQGFGWMGWAKNGASAGSKGWAKRVEAIQVKIVFKGAAAPGSTANAFQDHAAYVKSYRDACNIHEDYRSQFKHGTKTAAQTKYIVLHDTEGGGTAPNIIDYWAGNGNRVAAHFIVQRDGQIWQCVDMEYIAHHAGYGNIGHNKKFGVTDESRDDKKATSSPTRYLPDYGMNSYSIGIEMIHQGNQSYTTAQLKSLDKLIAYIDVYYGKELTIIDHKMWRIGNSDTSAAFSTYLENYRDHRSYK